MLILQENQSSSDARPHRLATEGRVKGVECQCKQDSQSPQPEYALVVALSNLSGTSWINVIIALVMGALVLFLLIRFGPVASVFFFRCHRAGHFSSNYL
jgi:hypothetical protein